MLGACSPGAKSTDPSASQEVSGWSESLRRTVASRDDLSADTVAILDEAADSGELSFQLYDRAVQNWATCVRALGMKPILGAPRPASGVDQYERSLQYPVGVEIGSPEEKKLDDKEQSCSHDLSVVENAYVTQPSATRGVKNTFEEYRAALYDCLRKNGSDIDEDASFKAYDDELARVPGDCSMETGYWEAQ